MYVGARVRLDRKLEVVVVTAQEYGIAALEINYMLLDLLYVATHRKHAYRAVIQYCQIDCVLVMLV